MRLWLVVAGSCLASGLASAQGDADEPSDDMAATARSTSDAAAPPPQRIGYGALPGGLHVAAAETMPLGTVEVGLLSGFGHRSGLLAADHSMNRAIGDIALAYAPI